MGTGVGRERVRVIPAPAINITFIFLDKTWRFNLGTPHLGWFGYCISTACCTFHCHDFVVWIGIHKLKSNSPQTFAMPPA